MSHESTEDRIERLESKVSKLAAEHAALPMIFKGLWERIFALRTMITALKNQQVAFVRSIAQSSLIHDEKQRRPLLDRVARMESDLEKAEAGFEESERAIKDVLRDFPPPDASAAPGSPT